VIFVNQIMDSLCVVPSQFDAKILVQIRPAYKDPCTR
jgi:hypothetical protein